MALSTQIWDIGKKRIRHLLQGHVQEIYSLDFSRDGQFLVSGSGDKTAKIWNIETGTCVFDLKIDDFVMGDTGPIDAGITSVARERPKNQACEVKKDADFSRPQSHPTQGWSLLEVSTLLSEFGTPLLVSKSNVSRVTKTQCIGGYMGLPICG